MTISEKLALLVRLLGATHNAREKRFMIGVSPAPIEKGGAEFTIILDGEVLYEGHDLEKIVDDAIAVEQNELQHRVRRDERDLKYLRDLSNGKLPEPFVPLTQQD